MRLLNNVHSQSKKDVLYGKAGEQVTVISDCGNVVIVEGPNGVRFPCKPGDLTEVLTNEKTELKPIIKQVTKKKRSSNNELF